MAAIELSDLPLDAAPLGLRPDGGEETDVEQDPAATRRELESLVQSDSVERRVIALVLLDRLAPEDPQVEHLLRDRLDNDDDKYVFRATAQALLRRYPADPTILDTIADRTQQYLGTRLAEAGVELLTQHRPTDPRTPTYSAYRSRATRAAISIHNHGLDDLPELTHPWRLLRSRLLPPPPRAVSRRELDVNDVPSG